jgi:hypothetical protein
VNKATFYINNKSYKNDWPGLLHYNYYNYFNYIKLEITKLVTYQAGIGLQRKSFCIYVLHPILDSTHTRT